MTVVAHDGGGVDVVATVVFEVQVDGELVAVQAAAVARPSRLLAELHEPERRGEDRPHEQKAAEGEQRGEYGDPVLPFPEGEKLLSSLTALE